MFLHILLSHRGLEKKEDCFSLYWDSLLTLKLQKPLGKITEKPDPKGKESASLNVLYLILYLTLEHSYVFFWLPEILCSPEELLDH